MLHRVPALALVAIIFLLTSCASVGPSFESRTPCEAAAYSVIDDFPGARRGRCTVLSDTHVRITILPEDEGYIIDSPWFSFKIIPNYAATATITINYVGGHHRYVPKTSSDGIHWSALDESRVSESSNGKQATFTVDTGDDVVWVSAQELFPPPAYDIWNQRMAASGVADIAVLGESLGERPISMLRSNKGARDVLLLVGRQHPAEVTGAIAFLAFYETLLYDTELAIGFRQHFGIVAIPMLHPTGVIGGNWRHNLGSTDLNRNWGPFRQPETQLIENLLQNLDSDGKKIRVFLDFHSTQENVFYTQDEDHPTTPPLFTRTWLDNAKPRIQNYEYTNQENPVDTIGVSKNYMYKRYGIPSSTYEVGDETDREAIRQAAKIFAEELMLLMLQQDYQ